MYGVGKILPPTPCPPVLLAGLLVKKFVQKFALQKHEKLKDSQAIEAYTSSWTKKKGSMDLGLQRRERKFIGRWEGQKFSKQMFVMPHRDSGTQRGIWIHSLCGALPAYPPKPISFIVTFSESSLPGPGSETKFLETVNREVRSAFWVFWTLIVLNSKSYACQSGTFWEDSFWPLFVSCVKHHHEGSQSRCRVDRLLHLT